MIDMNQITEELLQNKPHLAEPIRFYDKTRKFTGIVQELLNALPADSCRRELNAYPTASVSTIVRQFTAVFELPEGSLSPLLQALELGEIDFMRLPLRETPAFSLPYAEEDLQLILFLISRPYFLGLRDSRGLGGRHWDKGKCPICGAQPSLSSIANNGSRRLFCPFCGTEGEGARTGCPVCLNSDPSKVNILTFEGEPGFKVHACGECASYVKTAEHEMLSRFTPELIELISLPLDFVAQEKGYARRSPNPIGIMNMVVRG